MTNDNNTREALIAELDWCITEGCRGPRTLEALSMARAALAADQFRDAAEMVSTPALPAGDGLTADQWIALAERHANADWNSEQPDGFLNAVKALVTDALPAPMGAGMQHDMKFIVNVMEDVNAGLDPMAVHRITLGKAIDKARAILAAPRQPGDEFMTTSELEEIARENAIQAAIDRLLHSDDLMDGISAVRAMLTNPPAAPRQPGEAKKLDADLLATIREAAKTRSEGAITQDGRTVFINYGDSEDQMREADAVACPHCGGSGHKDDVVSRQPGEVGAGVSDYANMQHVGVFCNINPNSEQPRWEQMQDGYSLADGVHLYRRKPTRVDLSPEWCLAAAQRELTASAQQDEPKYKVNRCEKCGGAKIKQSAICTGTCDCESAQQDEREAFEAAILRLFPTSYGERGFELRADGQYRNGFIREAWIVWQARAAQQVQADAGAVALTQEQRDALDRGMWTLEEKGFIKDASIIRAILDLATRPAAESDKGSAPTDVLRRLLAYAERNECHHEETHRGGAIWTICDCCGKKWADDEGGFKPYVEPKAIADARAILAAMSREQSGGGE